MADFWNGTFGKSILQIIVIGLVAFIGFWSGSRVQIATIEVRMCSMEKKVEAQTEAFNGLVDLIAEGTNLNTAQDGKFNTLDVRITAIKEDLSEHKNRKEGAHK